MNIYKTIKLYHFWLLNVHSSENLRKLQPFRTGSIISKLTLYQFVQTHWFRESLLCQKCYLETVLRKEIQKSCMQMTWTHPSLPPLQVNSVSCTLCKSYTESSDSLAWLDENCKKKLRGATVVLSFHRHKKTKHFLEYVVQFGNITKSVPWKNVWANLQEHLSLWHKVARRIQYEAVRICMQTRTVPSPAFPHYPTDWENL